MRAGHTFSRRSGLRLLGAAGALATVGTSGCSLLGGPQDPKVLPSTARLPKPFRVPLPILPVLKPTRTKGDTDYYDLPARSFDAEILPGLKTTVWGYGGRFPGPTVESRTGRRSVVRQRNALPVPIVTHLHGGRTPPASDGYPTDLIMPARGSFPSHDPRASVARERRTYEYPHDQRAATLWYHDHRMDFTGPQAWRGLVGFHIIRDDEDDALPLPKGDREIPLLICDRSFGADGALRYPSLQPSLHDRRGVKDPYMGGVLGDVILVNGAPWPQLEVSGTRYRFRVLNASNARRYDLALDPPPTAGPAFTQVGSDGGLLAAPVTHDSITIAPAERFDVVVDFSAYPVGTTVTMRNKLGDGSTGRVMRFRVVRRERDHSTVPGTLSKVENLKPSGDVAERTFNFVQGDVDGKPGWVVDGLPFDPDRMDARPKLGSTEVWRLTTDAHHPIHLHLVHFQVLGRGAGGPGPYDAGWKDTVDLGPGDTAKIIVPFRGYRGRYVFHCHNLEHEDMAMMANFETV